MDSLTFDLANFFNTILGSLIGAALSLIISYIFFIKGKGLEFITSWMANNLGEALIRQTHPQFFGQTGFHHLDIPTPGPDLDVPHLDIVVFNYIKNSSMNRLELLFRVSDSGWNFPMAAGVRVTNPAGNAFPVMNSLFGYMTVDIPIPTTQPLGIYRIEFHMNDIQKVNKTNRQSVEVILD